MNKQLKMIITAAGFALLLITAVIGYQLLSSRVESPMDLESTSTQRQAAPDFSMVDNDGNAVRFSSLFGKPIVLNFWASWCPPCRIEMPDFDRVWKELGTGGTNEVYFVMLNLVDGRRETVEIAQRYINEHGYSFPVYFDVHQEGARAYFIRSIPTTIFIDRDGNIINGIQGAINEQTLRRGIDLIR